MPYRKILLSGLLVVSLHGYAQNLGYLNKKTTIGVGAQFEGPEFPMKPLLYLQMERSLGHNASIEIGVSKKHVNSSFDDHEYLINNTFEIQKFNDDQYNSISYYPVLKGSVEGNITNINLVFKSYITKRGAIAPFGKFISLGLKTNLIQLTAVDAYMDGTLTKIAGQGKQTYPVKFRMSMDDEIQQSVNVGSLLGIGEKRFISRGQFLEYMAGIQFTGAYLKRYWSPSSQNQAAHLAITADQQKSAFFYLKVVYGFGI